MRLEYRYLLLQFGGQPDIVGVKEADIRACGMANAKISRSAHAVILVPFMF